MAALANSTKKAGKKHIELYVKFIVICKNLKDNTTFAFGFVQSQKQRWIISRKPNSIKNARVESSETTREASY